MGNIIVKSKIDSEGKVEIPETIREAADLYCGESISFSYNEAEDILILKPVSNLCKICENEKGEIVIDENISICAKCRDLLSAKLH